MAELQRLAFGYFEHEITPWNGLVRDSTKARSPATIAGSGFALSCYPVAVERGYLSRADAVARTLTSLRFLWEAPQNRTAKATGYRGFFYHFLDMTRGTRARWSELSTVDSAILFAGALVAAAYFDRENADETEIRDLADAIYRRADWRWASPRAPAISHGWKPYRGFINYDWRGYNEALFLYLLALGSPTFPVPESAWTEWTSGYQWRKLYGHEFLYGGPLFFHQYSHIWVDFRGVQDAYMRSRGSDYFENSRRATLVQREYARRNPRGLTGYDEWAWGISACDGPGPLDTEDGRSVSRAWSYRARGAPFGPDDGTLAPTAVAASLPFAPDVVASSLAALRERYPAVVGRYGLTSSFNPSRSGKGDGSYWVSPYYAIDVGPAVLMTENHQTGLIWRLMRKNPHLRVGLERAGFAGGWLDEPALGG